MTADPIVQLPDHAADGAGLRVRLLGPALFDGSPLPSARKDRQTFALLAVRAGALTSNDDLIRELWDGKPPGKPQQSVQTYVMYLRRFLPRGMLVTAPAGYMLVVGDPWGVDTVRFTQLVDQARREHKQGRLSLSLDTLRAAFSLWRGEPFEDVQPGPVLATHAAGLVDRYRTAVHLRIDIDLEQGRHREVVDELADLLRGDPTREDTAGRLMLALYRSQRRVDALDVYRRLRCELLEVHGLDPCGELRVLQQQILTEDPALDYRNGGAA